MAKMQIKASRALHIYERGDIKMEIYAVNRWVPIIEMQMGLARIVIDTPAGTMLKYPGTRILVRTED